MREILRSKQKSELQLSNALADDDKLERIKSIKTVRKIRRFQQPSRAPRVVRLVRGNKKEKHTILRGLNVILLIE